MALIPWRIAVPLAGFAWDVVLHHRRGRGKRQFGHAAEAQLPDGSRLLGSYRVSQQRIFTRRLTVQTAELHHQRTDLRVGKELNKKLIKVLTGELNSILHELHAQPMKGRAVDDWDELVGMVEENDNLATVTMVKLRNLAGWTRLTAAAADTIEDGLKQNGLGYFPHHMPTDRHAEIRIYRLGTPMGRLVESVLDPTEHGDSHLRDIASGNASDVLQRVRRLVCED